MNRADALRVLRKLSAYQPGTTIDRLASEAFAEALEPHDVRDALEAVTKLCTAPRRQGEPWQIELRDIVTECARVETERERVNLPRIEPPTEAGRDPAAYKTWLATAAKRARSRDFTPPALTPGRPHPAVAALTHQKETKS